MRTEVTKREALDFIADITRAMNQSDNPEGVLEQILGTCIQVTGGDSGSIMLLNAEKTHLDIRVSRGLTKTAETLRLAVGQGVTGWVARHGQPRIVNDSHSESDYIRIREDLEAELAVPMLVRDEVIGVISVDALRKEAFVPEHQHFLSIMANLAARIFVNLTDNRLLKMRDRFHRVMIEISRVFGQSLQLSDVFREIMSITEKAFRLQGSALLLYDAQDDALKIAAAVGPGELKEVRYSPGEGITGSVYLNKKAVFIPSVSKEPGFLNRMGIYEGTEDFGFFCCPIFSGTDVVGAFSTFTRAQGGLDPESFMEFLEIVGSMISQEIAIQRLFKEETRVIAFENIQLKRELSSRYQFGSLIGRSSGMLKLFEKVRIIADSRASVLITGESGTGKELIASAIHYNSPRRDQPFIKINCAAIPDNLLESELFGYRKGSFTGAVADKKGKFEIADGGTIFLDEIGELDLNLQSKLLRVLQEREIEPIGGRTRQVDIRVIAATNANLEEAIANRRFRPDLYYRLNVINLTIPPLRERREDILALVQHFIEKYNAENHKNITGILPEAVQLLQKYEWPGNVRQLENVIERAVVMSRGDVLTADDFRDSSLPFGTEPQTAPAVVTPVQAEPPEATDGLEAWTGRNIPREDSFDGLDGRLYETVIGEVEKRLIVFALKKYRYTKTQAARYLGINRNTLDKKIRELNIDY